mmetsp:Transcript_5494/g.7973  ORF Transcript_5494/g.7973 Transcript_5494/m.7973 type:complete len:235 (-) Transcript_5494:155-859(-)|eukprot:CAMPEP_0194252868 /NCGR_PEP_ID=MMETSP0158-20130606/28635_1 /TAXON_ID=33649 /ORGANISM="Thalassionema nitzschioides, Strain L26-B" /LENGTH=234 /DNA_ID=CAMNT_0038990397 /DNA_START=26 /DNA_END=730 /DNA_ORIENTATION=+
MDKDHDDIELFVEGDEIVLDIRHPFDEDPVSPQPKSSIFKSLPNCCHCKMTHASGQMKSKQRSTKITTLFFIGFVFALLIASIGLSIGLSGDSAIAPVASSSNFAAPIESFPNERQREDKYLVALESGGRMFREEYVYSPNLEYILEFSQKGSLVFRNATNVLWESNDEGGGYKCSLQPNGDIVIRRENGRTTWRSGTENRRLTELRLYDSGQIKLVSPEGIITWVQGYPDFID